jgi:hypothetical protein
MKSVLAMEFSFLFFSFFSNTTSHVIALRRGGRKHGEYRAKYRTTERVVSTLNITTTQQQTTRKEK